MVRILKENSTHWKWARSVDDGETFKMLGNEELKWYIIYIYCYRNSTILNCSPPRMTCDTFAFAAKFFFFFQYDSSRIHPIFISTPLRRFNTPSSASGSAHLRSSNSLVLFLNDTYLCVYLYIKCTKKLIW